MLRLQYYDQELTEPYEVEFSRISPHVVQVKGSRLIRSESGFFLSRLNHNDHWDYWMYRTIYRVLDDGLQFSDDGSVYVEPLPPTKTVVVAVEWNGVNPDVPRPKSVSVKVSVNGTRVETIVLSDSNNWQKTYLGVPMDDVYTVEEEEIIGYETTYSGTTIINSVPAPLEPTIEEQLLEINVILCDLDNRVYGLENKEGDIDG